jgi:hypothetical protein
MAGYPQRGSAPSRSALDFRRASHHVNAMQRTSTAPLWFPGEYDRGSGRRRLDALDRRMLASLCAEQVPWPTAGYPNGGTLHANSISRAPLSRHQAILHLEGLGLGDIAIRTDPIRTAHTASISPANSLIPASSPRTLGKPRADGKLEQAGMWQRMRSAVKAPCIKPEVVVELIFRGTARFSVPSTKAI